MKVLRLVMNVLALSTLPNKDILGSKECSEDNLMGSKTTMLRALLDERFFNSCLVHEEDKKNEENSFCMDCCFSLCLHCVPHHQSHRILQIRRYMYNDVLRLRDAQKIFDCSLIQSYTTNSEKVVLLRARQRVTYPIRGSRCTCLVCNQNINSSFVYCSMLCKFNNVTASKGGQVVYASSSKELERSSLASGSIAECVVSTESSVEENSSVATAGDETNYGCMEAVQGLLSSNQKRSTTPSSNGIIKKLHGRKCVPQRSPLF